MTATKTQLIGGVFQDGEGNVLANGYLEFELNQDSSVTGVGNICSGITIHIDLDSAGNVASSTSTPAAANQYIWANDVLQPDNSFYQVTGFTAEGQPAWGPNNQQVTSGGTGGGTFDLGTWVPNQVFSWTPPLQPFDLETNGVDNQSQTLLNLKQGTGITLTNSGGDVTFDVSASSIVLPPSANSFLYCDGTGTQPQPIGIDGVSTVSISAVAHAAGSVAGEGTCVVYTGDPNPQNNTSASWRAGLDSGQTTNVRSTLISAQRFTIRQAMASAAHYRYWIGVTTSSTLLNGAVFGTNTPNVGFVGFRFSFGTDTTWKAVASTDSSHQTVVDTGVAFSASPSTLFQIVPNSTGTSVQFYINGTLVATISTNLPGANSPVQIFGTGDNQNQSATPVITFCYALIEYK